MPVTIYSILIIISYAIKLCVFIYMVSNFIIILQYFIGFKTLMLKSRRKTFSYFNYFVIAIIYCILLARMIETLALDFVTITTLAKEKFTASDEYLFRIAVLFRGFVLPFRDLTELLMISYMIYYQDRK